MNDHYKISEVAALLSVSIRTLKYYDTMGLLEPEYRDEYTGYRFYSGRNINQLSYILMLKQCGFTLREIKNYFGDAYVAGTFIRELTRKRDRLTSNIEKLQEYHESVEIATPKEEDIPDVMALHSHFVADSTEHISENFKELLDTAIHFKVRLVTSYCYIAEYETSTLFQNESYINTYLEIDADAVPHVIPSDTFITLPGGHFVTYVVHGDFSGLRPAEQQMYEYCKKRNLTPEGPTRKYYLRHPGDTPDPSKYVTKLALRVL